MSKNRPNTREVYSEFLKWLEQAPVIEKNHRAAGISVPPEVNFVLGKTFNLADLNKPIIAVTEASTPSKRRGRSITSRTDIKIPKRPDYGLPPLGGEPDWIPVWAVDATPRSLAIAVLKGRETPLSKAALSHSVSSLRGLKGNNAGSNALMKLVKDGDVVPIGDGFILANRQLGGLLAGTKVLWLPREEMTDGDRAAHRREVEMLMLELNGPLLTAEITRGLESTPWMYAGKNSNFVKADMAQLERDGKVERLESKHWKVK